MKQRRKKRKHVRTKDWTEKHEDSFTHDLKRHRHTDTAITSSPAQSAVPEDFIPNGLVISHTKKWAFVRLEDGEALCRIDESILEGRTTLLAPGDEVLVEQDGDEAPMVRAIAPRRTRLCRLAIEGSRVAEQVVAANIDILVIVAAAARPELKPGLIDRYLITAEIGDVTPILCVNKMDLVDDLPIDLQVYRDLDLKVIQTSCETGQGIEELRGVLEGKVSVVAGQSGAGKSSILNALGEHLNILTQDVSESSQKGRHTTSGSRLYEIRGNITIIDTPGIRQLGLWGVVPEEVSFYFPDLARYATDCRFRDCTHTHEPGCAVLKALESKEIYRLRYDSYLRIRGSIEEKEPKH